MVMIGGFYFLLVFVGATIPAGIYCKTVYGTSLANVDWIHGSAESLLTVTNLLLGAPTAEFRVFSKHAACMQRAGSMHAACGQHVCSVHVHCLGSHWGGRPDCLLILTCRVPPRLQERA